MLISTTCLVILHIIGSKAHVIQRTNSLQANIPWCFDHKNLHASVFITVLASSLHRPIAAEAILPITSNSNIFGILFTGYKIEANQYNSLAKSLSSHIDFSILTGADDADSTIDSLIIDAEAVLTEAQRSNSGIKNLALYQENKVEMGNPLLLMGHSRGGAVAALAATKLLQNNSKMRKSNKSLSTDKLDIYLPKLLLVLLDPVDTEKGSVVRALQESYAQFDSSRTQAGTDSSIWHFPVLIVSTPYGGFSSYYKVIFV